MKSFYYQPGPAGSGKTYQLVQWAAEKATHHDKVLIAQPTKALLDETLNSFRKEYPDVQAQTIHSGNVDRAVSKVVEHLKNAVPHQGEVLLITHETLSCLPSLNRQFWHLVVDEVPSVLNHIDLQIADTHSLVTKHFATSELANGLSVVSPANASALEAVHINTHDDQNLSTFKSLVGSVLAKDQHVFVKTDEYADLINPAARRRRMDFFAVQQPDFVEGYKSTTFMGANIECTELFLIWQAIEDVRWQLHPDMGSKLRYQAHTNGNRLTLYYLFDGRLSKRFLGSEDSSGGSCFDRVTEFVARYWKNEAFLWQANKDAMPKGFSLENRLPGNACGLNKAEFKTVNRVALLSAMNRKTAAYGFLEKLGISSELAQASISHQNDYQAMMRCSLRVPNAIGPVSVIVGSRDCAEWLQARFPGSIIQKLDHGIEEPRKAGGQPLGDKPSKALSSAERVRRCRAKKKAAQKAQGAAMNEQDT
jgi:hypothetical protein